MNFLNNNMIKKKFSALNEDSSMIYNKWVSGIAKRDLDSDVITVNDIVDRFRNRSQAPKVLPYPLNYILDFLGEIFVQTANLRRLLQQSINNPVIKEKKEKINAVREINEKMDKVQQIIYSITEDLNKIVDN